MKGNQWFEARIRWAVMVEGKQGLRRWEESVCFILSEDARSAFRQALDFGRSEEREFRERGQWVEKRLAQIVELNEVGPDDTVLAVSMGSKKPKERLPFDHAFEPERSTPVTNFG